MVLLDISTYQTKRISYIPFLFSAMVVICIAPSLSHLRTLILTRHRFFTSYIRNIIVVYTRI